jgi:hypothetical protein
MRYMNGGAHTITFVTTRGRQVDRGNVNSVFCFTSDIEGRTLEETSDATSASAASEEGEPALERSSDRGTDGDCKGPKPAGGRRDPGWGVLKAEVGEKLLQLSLSNLLCVPTAVQQLI